MQNMSGLLLSKSHNMEKLLIITLIVPFMPDDVACLVSGLSKMKFSRYCAIILILKPWSIALYSLFLIICFSPHFLKRYQKYN